MRFLGLLIQDLDNPFGYYEGDSVEDVSLKPLEDVISRLREIDQHVNSSAVGEVFPHHEAVLPRERSLTSAAG
jgi:hypothetical protein